MFMVVVTVCDSLALFGHSSIHHLEVCMIEDLFSLGGGDIG